MSRKYYEWQYLGLGRIGFSVPGFLMDDGQYIAFAQSDPVFRVALNTTNAAWLDVDISTTGGWRGSDPLACSQHIAAGATDTVYIPMAEVIQAAIVRTFAGLSPTPTVPGVTMTVVFAVKNSSLATLETTSIDLTAYDSIGMYAAAGQYDWRLPGLPDKFRLFKDRDNYMTFTQAFFVPTALDPYSFVQYYAGGSTSDYPITPTGEPRVIKIVSSGSSYTTALGFRRDSGDMLPLFTANVEWVPCTNESVMLVWWSPELGGWKTVVADVVSTADGITERDPQMRGFGRVNGISGHLSLNLRLPLLTQNDYIYYRDLLFSDEVYLDDWFLLDYEEGMSTIRKAVRVSGSLPAWRVNDVKDFDFTINYDYTNEL